MPQVEHVNDVADTSAASLSLTAQRGLYSLKGHFDESLDVQFTTQSDSSEARSAPVLVQCAKSHRGENSRFSVSIYADVVKVAKAEKTPGVRRQLGSGRKRISTFSNKSRKLLLERLAQLRNVQGGYFVTLTYGGRFAWDMADTSRHLDTFLKAVQRHFPGCGWFWRREWKERLSGESAGELVPHFHLLIFGLTPPTLARLRAWINRTWTRIAHYPDSEPRKLRTQCDAILNRAHAARYASKYAAKSADVTEFKPELENCYTGRHWGHGGELDMAAAATVEIGINELIQFKRLVRSWLKSRGRTFARRLARIREDFGFGCFGLGDLSLHENSDVFESTALRMLLHAATQNVGQTSS